MVFLTLAQVRSHEVSFLTLSLIGIRSQVVVVLTIRGKSLIGGILNSALVWIRSLVVGILTLAPREIRSQVVVLIGSGGDELAGCGHRNDRICDWVTLHIDSDPRFTVSRVTSHSYWPYLRWGLDHRCWRNLHLVRTRPKVWCPSQLVTGRWDFSCSRGQVVGERVGHLSFGWGLIKGDTRGDLAFGDGQVMSCGDDLILGRVWSQVLLDEMFFLGSDNSWRSTTFLFGKGPVISIGRWPYPW